MAFKFRCKKTAHKDCKSYVRYISDKHFKPNMSAVLEEARDLGGHGEAKKPTLIVLGGLWFRNYQFNPQHYNLTENIVGFLSEVQAVKGNFRHVIFVIDPMVTEKIELQGLNMIKREMIPAAHSAAKVFPELVIMDSHLKVYEEYCRIEHKYDIVTRNDYRLKMNHRQRYFSHWGGDNSTIHPGHVVTVHYTNLILNFVCQPINGA